MNSLNVHPIDNNSEDIDEFLSNEGQKNFASVLVEDTQQMLDAFDSGIDLDWMHTAFTADNSDELKDMFNDIWEGYEEETSYGDEEEYMFDEEFEGEYEEAMEDADEEWAEEEEEFLDWEDDMEEDYENWEDDMSEDWIDFEESMDEDYDWEEAYYEEDAEALMNVKAWGNSSR